MSKLKIGCDDSYQGSFKQGKPRLALDTLHKTIFHGGGAKQKVGSKKIIIRKSARVDDGDESECMYNSRL